MLQAAIHFKHHAQADREATRIVRSMGSFMHMSVGSLARLGLILIPIVRTCPRSAFHGLHWGQVDLSGYVIWLLERLGLVYDVYRVPPAVRARRAIRKEHAVPPKSTS
jgi:hypothetical protein